MKKPSVLSLETLRTCSLRVNFSGPIIAGFFAHSRPLCEKNDFKFNSTFDKKPIWVKYDRSV